jgi:hypothetical protein
LWVWWTHFKVLDELHGYLGNMIELFK